MTNELVSKMGQIGFIIILIMLIAIDVADIIRCRRRIRNAPTVDAVEVVRCKDCKWRGELGCAVSIVDESDRPKDNDFCSWGERKDETD